MFYENGKSCNDCYSPGCMERNIRGQLLVNG